MDMGNQELWSYVVKLVGFTKAYFQHTYAKRRLANFLLEEKAETGPKPVEHQVLLPSQQAELPSRPIRFKTLKMHRSLEPSY